MNKKRIGITGSKGFIGRHLLNRLSKEFSQANIAPFDPRYEDIPSCLDIIYHLGFNTPFKYRTNFSNSRNTDLKVAEKLATYCKLNKTTLLFASSSAVYTPSSLPVKEDENIGPVSPYGQAKYEIEQLFTDYSNSVKFPLVILRLFNPYGPGQSKDFVVYQIIDAFNNETPISIQQPNSGRDFIYIDDCISALQKASNLEADQIIINIGTGIETKIIDLVKIISEVLKINSKIYIKMNPNSFSFHPSSIANIERMKNSLNFYNIIPLKLGIKKMLNNYESLYSFFTANMD